jgi:hypothetical protein
MNYWHISDSAPEQRLLPRVRSRMRGIAVGRDRLFSVRHRALKAVVWRNELENGPMFNTTVSRSYKDGDTWKESGSFGFDDVLIVAELLRTCHSFITREMAKQNEEARE